MADDVKYKGTSWSESNSQSSSTTNQQSETKKVLDTELLNTILSGLVGQMTDEQLVEAGVAPDLIRFSVGIENVNDIINDLAQAIDSI